MNKKILILSVLLLSGLANIAAGVAPVKSIDEYRGEDSKRTYLFLINNQQFGILESAVRDIGIGL